MKRENKEMQPSPGEEHELTRLAIVDDHELARASLQNMLSDEPDIELVGEAANGREALLLCSRLRPDLVLMDVRMPEMDGLAATREIKQRYPQISVLMLTMHENPDYLFEALKAGAAGYVLKDASQEVVVEAIRRVREGESPLDTALAARLLRRLAAESERRVFRSGPEDQHSGSLTQALTRRLQARLPVPHGPHPLPNQVVIVGEEQPGRLSSTLHSRYLPLRTMTGVPPPPDRCRHPVRL